MVARRTLFVCGLAREAALARGQGVETIVSGGDVGVLAAALGRHDPQGLRRVVSFGLAGGLDPNLKAGALVIGAAVADASERFEADEDLLAALRTRLPDAATGVVAGVDTALTSVSGKAACRERFGAVAVDMESHLAARFAARHGLPFAALRAISDPAGAALPALVKVALRPDGRLAPGAILTSLWHEPRQIAMLPGLAGDSRRAFAALADAWTRAASILAPG